MAKSKKTLSIIIPAFKEGKRLGGTLDELGAYLGAHGRADTEVIVVVSKSPDNTLAVAKNAGKKFKNFTAIEEPPQGKGSAVKHGMLKATGDYRLFMDADLATPLHHLQSLEKHMQAGKDVIIGVRDLAKIHKRLLRKLISGFGNLLVKLVLLLKIKDTQCGFKAFKGQVAEDLFSVQSINGWGFDMELLAVARKRRYSLATINIHDWRDVAGGTLGVGISASISTFVDLGKIRVGLWFGKYKRS